jgi:asparagine synthetase B (glutamine-hydrolysing)
LAGFALLIDTIETPNAQSPAWIDFLDSVAHFKYLDRVGGQVEGNSYVVAKFDAPCSLHQGVTLDAQTGSWLVAVGTVFDHVEICSDGSLVKLLRDYVENGMQVFSRLDGQFALIAYHALENRLCIVTDPFGFIPIYCGQDKSRYYVSTSALAVAKAVRSKPNDIELRTFLLYGDTLEGSLWKDVQTLKPATVLTITPEKNIEFIYWSFNQDPAVSSLSLDQTVECIIESLSQTIKEFFTRERKFWLSLTGGLDSRTLAALAQYNEISFKTYCHGPSDSRDVRLAAAISQHLGWEHEYFTLPAEWGYQRVDWLPRALGQTDGHMNVLKISRIIREQTIKAEQMKVSLWGYGGEIYRGYYWKQEFWKTGKTSSVDYERLLDFRIIPSDASILQGKERWQHIIREAKKNRLQAIGEQHPDLLNTVKLDLIGQYLERHSGGNTIAGVLGQQRVLLPYYSKDSISQILSTNYQWRMHSRIFRHILERINPTLAGIETADGGPALPMRLANIHKFIPYWMDTGEKLLWRYGYKFLKKSIRNRRDAGPFGKAYPIGMWLQETITQLRDQELLIPNKMHSGNLYDENQLQALLDGSLRESQDGDTMIGRILTIELAMRAVGTSI